MSISSPSKSIIDMQNNLQYLLKEKYKIEEKLEYDLKDEQIPLIESLTHTKIQYTIGSGGFSVVKLVSKSNEMGQNEFYALKVVSFQSYSIDKFKEQKIQKKTRNKEQRAN